MKCQVCGHECPQGVIFCSQCGAKLEAAPTSQNPKEDPGLQVNVQEQSNTSTSPVQLQQNETHQAEQPQMSTMQQPMNQSQLQMNSSNSNMQTTRKKIPMKLIALGGGALVVIIVAVLLITKFFFTSSDYFYYSEDSISAWREYIDHETGDIFVLNDNIIVSAEDMANYTYSPDYLTFAVLAYDDTLSVVTKKGLEEIAEQVNNYVISDDGSKIVYIDYDEDRDDIGDLYSYDVAKGESKKISSNCFSTDIKISPDGNSIAYIKDYEDEDKFKLFTSIDGKEAVVGNGMIPIAISNNGSYLYYLDGDKIYVKTTDDKQRLASNYDGTLYFNYDYSEVLYEDDDNTYISIKGSEKQKVSDDDFYSIVLPDRVMISGGRYLDSSSFGSYTYIVLGIKNFTNQVYELDSEYYFVDSKLECHPICPEYVDCVKISEDGKSILYSYEGSLYYQTNLTDKKLKPERIAKDIDIDEFVANADLTDVYFVNYDDELMYVNSKGKTSKIADDVSLDFLYKDFKDDTFYFLQDEDDGYGTLYYSKEGSKKTKIKDADNVRLGRRLNCLYYTIDNGDDTYNKYILREGKAKLFVENTLNNY